METSKYVMGYVTDVDLYIEKNIKTDLQMGDIPKKWMVYMAKSH